MAVEVPGFKPGILKAGADLSLSQFLAVKLDGNGDLVLAGDGDLAAAMLQNKPQTGQGCEIDMDGISKAVSGASFSIGDKLAADANGKLITAASGKHVVAVALEAAANADEILTVKVVGLSGQLLA